MRKNTENINNFRWLLFGLLIKCPFRGESLDDCPLVSLRNVLSLNEKFSYATKLNAMQTAAFLRYHDGCFDARISNRLPDIKKSDRNHDKIN